jgi:hypothetical protein
MNHTRTRRDILDAYHEMMNEGVAEDTQAEEIDEAKKTPEELAKAASYDIKDKQQWAMINAMWEVIEGLKIKGHKGAAVYDVLEEILRSTIENKSKLKIKR